MLKVEIPDTEIKKMLRDLGKYGDDQKQKTKDNLHKAGIKIESDAKLDIVRNNHVDTARLKNSVHMESNTINRNFTYTDDDGNQFQGNLGVQPDEMEVYVGTNVEYAEKIRQLDDYLFPYAEQERVKLIGRLRKQLSEV
jgi:hypothetical protein